MEDMKGNQKDRSQFIATLLVILAVAISSYISTSILNTRLIKMEIQMTEVFKAATSSSPAP